MEQKENKTQATAQKIRDMIQDGTYKSGDKLPNELELSNLLGISRTTLREALRILISEGVLEVQRGIGTYVKNPLSHRAEPALNDFSNMKVTLRDLYEARLIFEPEAATLACQRATDEEIEEILRLGEEVQKYILEDPEGDARIASENAFHSAIIRAAHNDFLSQFMPIITETLEKTFALRINLDVIAEDAYKDHIMIMKFLKLRDGQAVKSAITIHLHHAVWHENIQL